MNHNFGLKALLLSVIMIGSAAAAQDSEPNVFNVRIFGAAGDGKALDTPAISKAIKAAVGAGGGRVVFPPGIYLTGTFELLSNVTLDVQAGAVIQGSKNLADYGSIYDFGLARIYAVNSSGEGLRVGIIIARDAENVGIIGRGVIDGSGDDFFDFTTPHASLDFDPKYTRQGQAFFAAVRRTDDGPSEEKPDGRPGTMIICSNCRNVLMRDVTLRNAPNWTAHFQHAQRIVASGVHILNNPLIPNNDGFDCMDCKDAHFSDCDIRTGDDDFAIVNSADVTVANCSMTSRSSAIRLEASSYSTFENLTIHANRGIGIFERGTGRTHHIIFAGITIETQLFAGHWWGKGEPIYIVTSKPKAGPESGQISDIQFSNINGEVESGILLYGHPEAPLRDISFNNINFKIRRTRKDVSDAVGGNFDLRWTATDLSNAVFKHDIAAIYGRYVEGIRLNNFAIDWIGDTPEHFTSAIALEDFKNLDVIEFAGRQAPTSQAAAISLQRGFGVSIRNSKARPNTGIFISAESVEGERLFSGNDVADARQVFEGNTAGFHKYGNYLPPKKPVATRKP